VGRSQEIILNVALNPSSQGYSIITREQLEDCKITVHSCKSMETGIKDLSALDSQLSSGKVFPVQ